VVSFNDQIMIELSPLKSTKNPEHEKTARLKTGRQNPSAPAGLYLLEVAFELRTIR